MKCTSNQIRRHPLNLRHIVVTDSVSVPIIPRDSDSTPRRCDNRTKVSRSKSPANAVTGPEESGLVLRQRGRSTRPNPQRRQGTIKTTPNKSAGAFQESFRNCWLRPFFFSKTEAETGYMGTIGLDRWPDKMM